MAISMVRPTLADAAYDRIETLLVTLQLEPGGAFTEGELAHHLGMGRTPLREALQRLAADGLVVAMPRRGMLAAPLNVEDMLAVVATRRALDRIVVASAARSADVDRRTALNVFAEAFESAAAATDLEAFLQADQACDAAIAGMAENEYAVRAVRPLHTHCRRFWYRYRHGADLRRSADLHVALIRAVAGGSEREAVLQNDGLLDYLVEFTRGILAKPT